MPLLQGWAQVLGFPLNTAASAPQHPREPGLVPVVASSAGPAPASGLAGSHSSPPAPRLPAALLGLERSHPDASQAGSAYHSSGLRVANAAPHLHW